MKFLTNCSYRILYFIFQKTALHLAVENGNIEIVKLLLLNPEIDVNEKIIFNENIFK